MLLVLGVGVACAMAWYILVGHNWNQAATHIDDMVGSMDGYTVVVFDGVIKRPKEADDDSQAIAKSSGGSSSSSTTAGEGRAEQQAASSLPSSGSSQDEVGDNRNKPEPEPSMGSSDSKGATPEESGASGAKEPSSGSRSGEKNRVVVRAQAVAASYEEKGAQTLLVDMKSLWKYEEPMILKRSGKRIGVFSSSGQYRRHVTSVRAKVRYLQRHSVDFIIALADDRSMLSDKIDGVDLLLLAKGGGLPGRGGYRGNMFCVDSPYIGEAQSVIISPSNVMTSQTVKEL